MTRDPEPFKTTMQNHTEQFRAIPGIQGNCRRMQGEIVERIAGVEHWSNVRRHQQPRVRLGPAHSHSG